jgi:hypothetical protein
MIIEGRTPERMESMMPPKVSSFIERRPLGSRILLDYAPASVSRLSGAR